MATPLIKRFRGYIAPALLAYTILVTFVLVQTAWKDGAAVRNGAHSQKTVHRYVPSKQERRHLRSFEDVDGYGNVGQNGRDRSLTNYGRGKFPTLQNGRRVQSSLSNDFYVDEANANATDDGTGSVKGALPPGGRDYILESRLYPYRSDTERRKFEGDGEDKSDLDAPRPHEWQPQLTNIEIEEMIPTTSNESSSTSVNKTVLKFRHHSSKDKKVGSSSKVERSSNSKDLRDAQRSGGEGTQFCDNIEENGRLCYRDRVVFSHRNHVNISSTHQSFRSFGGLNIFSAFVDSRQTPAAIRIMTIGPKGYANGASNLWCAFSSPMAVSRRYQWTGQEDNVATGRTQASQLHFYAASDGHDKSKQFYVLSCDVPENYSTTLSKLDGNHIDIVAGTRTSSLLDIIQERMPITVINNKGLPLDVLKQQNFKSGRNPMSLQSRGYLDDKTGQRLENRTTSDSNAKSSQAGERDITQVSGKLNVTGKTNSESRPFPGGQDALVSCVAPVYDLNGIVQITEFIELTLLLGIQHIVFYTHHISADVQQILKMYKEQGLVTVLPWHIPDATDIWAKGRDVALNDCLYRTMFLYDFVFFHDLDEFLIPRATPDLPSLMAFFRTKGKLNTTRISDIVFNSAYFSPPTKAQLTTLSAMPGYTKDVPKFITLRGLHRTYFSSQHTLRIIKPSAALRVGAGERKRTTFYINPRFAGVNHYTKCPTTTPSMPAAESAASNPSGHRDKRGDSSKTGQSPAVDCVHTKSDDVMFKYKDKLIQNTKDSIRAFNIRGRVRR